MFQTEEIALNRGNPHISTVTYHVREGGGGIQPAILRTGDDPDLADLRDNLRDEFERLITQAQFALEADGFDSIGVGLYGQDQNGQDVRIYVPLTQWEAVTPDRILDAIDNVLNSAQTFLLDFDIRFTIVHRTNAYPAGAMLGTHQFKGDVLTFIRKKRGVLPIHPPDDPYNMECLWQFCAIGLLHLLQQQELPVQTFQRLRLPWEPKLYTRCVKSKEKYKVRHTCALELQECIRMHEPTTYTQPFEVIRFVEQLFHVRIVIYNFKNQFARMYPLGSDLPVIDRRPTFFGLLSEWETFTHMDYVTLPESLSMKDFKSSKRVCLFCFEVYARSRSCGVEACQKKQLDRCLFCHVCTGLCETCCSQDCGWNDRSYTDPERRPYQGFKPSCPTCKRRFFSPRCKSLHEPLCAHIVNKRCELCGKPDHRSLGCNETYCMMCAEKYEKGEAHDCFLRVDKLKEPTTRYWAYDFETALDENKRHTLYLCTAWPLYPVAGIEELKSKYQWKATRYPDQPVFIFWGLEGSLQFFDFLMEGVLAESHFFAHNGGRYDTIFIEYYMTIKKGLLANKIQRGLNELQLVFPQLKICFKDSRNFINTALRNMSSDFGIEELKKGYFPHRVVTVDWFKQAALSNFQVPLPAREDFESEFAPGLKGVRERAALEQFLDMFYEERSFWDMKQDAIDYCISDTLLLGETLKLFREDTMEMTDKMDRPDHVEFVQFDPLLHVTLPSAVMKFYLSQMLPEKTIPIIDRYPCLNRIDEEKWLLWLEYSKGLRIVRESSFMECSISGVREQGQQTTLYRFLSCYEWGCNQCYRSSAWNVRSGKSFHHCWNQHIAETNKIRSHQPVGTRIVDCWTHQWFEICDSKEFKQWELTHHDFIEANTPMDPREAYKGGISELYKLHVPGKIQMVDFVSQYPTSMLGASSDPYQPDQKIEWGMPTGTFKRIVFPKQYELRKEVLGVIKCVVLPPRDLYAPFLGYRVTSHISSQSYEVIYGNCRTCMEERALQCTHAVEERAFTGTWTLIEMCYAQTLGYEILKVMEVWEYSENNTTLFRDFMVPFIISKTCCKRSGLVDMDNQFTGKGQQTADWLEELTGRVFTPDDFVNAPSKRNVAKLIMNSFYGKWGQRSQWSETRSYKEEQDKECMQLFANTQLTIRYVEVIHQHKEIGPVVYVDYEHRLPAVKGCSQKNDHIAAHITAYGRMMINTLVQKMGRKSIYIDTDSLFHQQTDDLPYVPGFRIGDLELELPDAEYWTGCARKWYSYKLPNGEHVAKQKGIALKSSSHSLFSPQRMLQFMLSTKQLHDSLKEEGCSSEEAYHRMKKGKVDVPKIPLQQTLFKTVQESKLVAFKQSVPMVKNTTFLLWSMKRIPQWNPNEEGVIDTLPFGFYSNTTS